MPMLSEPARNVIFSLFVSGISEQFGCLVVLHELPQIEERCIIAYARRLLHVVRDDDDRVLFF